MCGLFVGHEHCAESTADDGAGDGMLHTSGYHGDRDLRPAQLRELNADRSLIKRRINNVAVAVDVPTHNIADCSLAHEFGDLFGGEVAAVDERRVSIGLASAVQIGRCSSCQVEHRGDGAVRLDGSLGFQPLQDGRARQQSRRAARLVSDSDGGRRRSACALVETDPAIDLHDIDAGRPALLKVKRNVVQGAAPADTEGARNGTEAAEVVGCGLGGARL